MSDSLNIKVQRYDSITLDRTYFTEEGYLVDHPIVTSVGIFEYLNKDGSIRRELRLPEEVFSEKSLSTYKGKPVIVTHDAGYVDKENVSEESIGTMLSAGYKDGDNVRAEIIIHDTDALKNKGLRELSLGYNLRLDETSGEYNGEHYDAIQRDIEINHLALVEKARAGEQARLNIDGKSHKEIKEERIEMSVKKRNNDDDFIEQKEETAIEAVEGSEQRKAERQSGATGEKENVEGFDNEENIEASDEHDMVQAVKDRRDRRDAAGDPEDLKGAMKVIAQQDEDIDALLGVIDYLKSEKAATDSEDIALKEEVEGNEKIDGECAVPANQNNDAADFRELLKVVRVGDRLNMDGLESMSIRNAKIAVLKNLKPSLRLDGKSLAYVSAAFDMAVNEMKARKGTNYQRMQMTRHDSVKETAAKSSAYNARQRMIERISK